PISDVFNVKIYVPLVHPTTTKRQILSAIAKIFDPLGWLSPVTVRAKILLQELWKISLDWDTPVPTNIHNQWKKYCEELCLLQSFSIPRCTTGSSYNPNATYELHGFCDGSL